MAGIKHLHSEDPELLRDVLNTRLVITEKLDGCSFSAENTGNGIVFYKRDERNPINRIDRTLMKLYEGPIGFIQDQEENFLARIPKGIRLCFEFFFDHAPINIKYDRIPKNGLCLTHAKVINENGNVKRIIDDISQLEKWADAIDVERPPVIFRGKPTPDQVDSLIEAAYSQDHSGIKNIFEEFEVGSILQENIDKSIEGFVIKHSSDNGESLYKVTDPDFTKQVKNKKDRDNGDLFELIIDDFCDTVANEKMIKNVVIEGDVNEDQYISVISSLFNSFINERGESLKGAEIPNAHFSEKDVFDINESFITNMTTLSYICNERIYRQIFRIVLNLFRKYRNRNKGPEYIDANRKEKINWIVQKVWDRINNNIPGLPTFKEYQKQQ